MGSVKMNGWLIEDNWLRGSFDVSSIDAGSWFLKEITKLKYIQVKVPLNHKIDKIPLRLVCPSLRSRILYIMAGTSWRKSRRHSSWRHQNSCYVRWWTPSITMTSTRQGVASHLSEPSSGNLYYPSSCFANLPQTREWRYAT